MLLGTIKDWFDMDPPIFKHDCEHCKHVANAQFAIDGKVVKGDVYICNESLIIRWSNEPSDYSSMDFYVLQTLTSDSELAKTFRDLVKEGVLNINVSVDLSKNDKPEFDGDNPF